MLLTPDQVLVVDWPHARVGAAWADMVFFAPSVAMQGGPPPWDLVARHPAARAADANAMTAVIAAMAGFFTTPALRPASPGLPTLSLPIGPRERQPIVARHQDRMGLSPVADQPMVRYSRPNRAGTSLRCPALGLAPIIGVNGRLGRRRVNPDAVISEMASDALAIRWASRLKGHSR